MYIYIYICMYVCIVNLPIFQRNTPNILKCCEIWLCLKDLKVKEGLHCTKQSSSPFFN